MNKFKKMSRVSALILSLGAYAAEGTDEIEKSGGCSIEMIEAPLFDVMDGLFKANNDSSSGLVTISCPVNIPYSVGIGFGASPKNNQRRLASWDGKHFIAYEIYYDPSFQNLLLDIGSPNVITGTGNGSAQSQTLYARIPAGQDPVPAGSYTDQIFVTIGF